MPLESFICYHFTERLLLAVATDGHKLQDRTRPMFQNSSSEEERYVCGFVTLVPCSRALLQGRFTDLTLTMTSFCVT